MKWVVKLTGDTLHLGKLALSLTCEDLKIACDGNDFVLTAGHFLPSDDAPTIRQRAELEAQRINGASFLDWDRYERIRVGAIFRCRDDGTREINVFAKPAEMRAQAISPSVKVIQADGTIHQSHPADSIRQRVELARSDETVDQVLEIYSFGELSWGNLYKIFEIVRDDFSVDAIVSRGWAKNNDIKCFTRTANAVGKDARHPVGKFHPPQNPMPISNARSLVKSIVHSWLEAKGSPT